MTYVTNKQRILSALRRTKRGMTAQQVSSKLDIDPNSFYSTVSLLLREHYPVTKKPGTDGLIRYSISE